MVLLQKWRALQAESAGGRDRRSNLRQYSIGPAPLNPLPESRLDPFRPAILLAHRQRVAQFEIEETFSPA